jgi:hypothetical protein
MTRHLHFIINERSSWDSVVHVDEFSIRELHFWLSSLKSLPNCVIAPIQRIPERIVFTDASSYAGAGYTVQFSNDIIHKMWTNDEIIKSSTWRELKAVEITLKGCVDFFKTKFVKLFTDNQNVERISEVGSMKNDLQSLAIDIFHFAYKIVCLKVQRIPRELNIIADQYSKIFHFGWSVAQNFSLF